MNNAVEYRGVWLAKGSESYALWEKKDFKKLEKHMKANERAMFDIIKHYNVRDGKHTEQ